MIGLKLAAMHGLKNVLENEIEQNRAVLPILDEIQEIMQDEAEEENNIIEMPFLHDMTPDIQSAWNLADFDPNSPNDEPNMNIAVMALILATNIESTVGSHAWSLIEYSLDRLGFTNIVHRYFEEAHKVNHPAMAFGRSIETVNGKTVVAAVYRGSSSFEDFISDAKAEPGGFHQAGVNATNELRAYCQSQGLTKENTILFITGHSYGASCASLVGISSTDLAEKDSIFCYSYATPNYIRNGLTGDGMKMFSFNSNEDVVPQVPVGPNLDKTGKVIWYDRTDLKLRHPEQYDRFLKLYKHFREADYDEDTDFLPDAYTFKPFVRKPVEIGIIRNHMPYTYMPFLLCGLSDEEVEGYIVPVPTKEEREADLVMSVGETYRLPLAKTGLLRWKSSEPDVAAVNDRGMLTAKKPGKATLKLDAPGGKQAAVKVFITEA